MKNNADGFLALTIAATVGLLGVLDILNADQIDSAILLTLALIAATLLRDRKLAARALDDSAAVHMINGPEVGRVHAGAHHETEQ